MQSAENVVLSFGAVTQFLCKNADNLKIGAACYFKKPGHIPRECGSFALREQTRLIILRYDFNIIVIVGSIAAC